MNKRLQIKALTFLLVLFLYANFSKSQTVYSNKEYARLGVFVGMTSSNLYRDTINYSSGIFVSGGLNYSMWLNDKLNLGVDLMYSGRSVKKESPIIKYRFGYLSVPVYLQYKFSENFRLNLGFEYSKFLNSQYSFIDGSKTSGMHIQSFSSNLDNDYGAFGGIEIDVKKDFTFATRYTYSLKSVTDTKSPYFGVFQFSFGYVINRSHKQVFGKKEL